MGISLPIPSKHIHKWMPLLVRCAHSMASEGHDKDNHDSLPRYRIGCHGCHGRHAFITRRYEGVEMAKDRKIDRVILGIQNDNIEDLAVLKPYEVKLVTHLVEGPLKSACDGVKRLGKRLS